VTIPHKIVAKEEVDEVDDAAEKMGAISCVVVREDGSLFGTNSDWIGFLRNLEYNFPKFMLKDQYVTVIGAGGGARAICYGLIRAQVKKITVVNKTLSKSKLLQRLYGDIICVRSWEDINTALEGSSLIVNATSLGMVGMEDHHFSFEAVERDALIYDIVYTPCETNLIRRASRNGNPICTGLGMLLHQGPVAWKHWFGFEPSVTNELCDLVRKDLEAEYGKYHEAG